MSASDAAAAPGRQVSSRLALQAAAYCGVFLMLAFAPTLLGDYALYSLNLMQVYILLAVGMNLVIGNARQFALSSAAMYGIGAYVSVILQTRYGVPFLPAAVVAIGAATVVSAGLSMLAWRVAGLYLAMVTFGFSEIFQFFAVHATGVTNGPDGMPAPRPLLFGLSIASHSALFYFCLVITFVAIFAGWLIERSRLGLRFTALGDSEVAYASLGYEPRITKTIAFAIQGAYAGCAGVMFAAVVGFIDPYSFSLSETIQSLTAIALGGLGSLAGAVVGAIVLTALDRVLIEIPGARELVFGAALLAVFLFFPAGLAGIWQRLMKR